MTTAAMACKRCGRDFTPEHKRHRYCPECRTARASEAEARSGQTWLEQYTARIEGQRKSDAELAAIAGLCTDGEAHAWERFGPRGGQ